MSHKGRSQSSIEQQSEYARQWRRDHPDYHREWRNRTGRSSPKGSPEHLAKIAAHRRPAEERFWEKVQKTRTCWLWTGAKTPGGYGFFGNKYPHRLAYEWVVGPIPAGFQIDHLCYQRACVNPEHLEAVTPAVNKERSRARRRQLDAPLRASERRDPAHLVDWRKQPNIDTSEFGRFWQKVAKGKPDECWLWLASTMPSGYGVVRQRGQVKMAHRVAYEYVLGPIPNGLHLDHLCRLRACVNPAHLEPVTSTENLKRGRDALRTLRLAQVKD